MKLYNLLERKKVGISSDQDPTWPKVLGPDQLKENVFKPGDRGKKRSYSRSFCKQDPARPKVSGSNQLKENVFKPGDRGGGKDPTLDPFANRIRPGQKFRVLISIKRMFLNLGIEGGKGPTLDPFANRIRPGQKFRDLISLRECF
jgi:hypothetical protein